MKKYIFFILLLGICTCVFSQENYFWHGGQGNWSDVNNWRLENGLMPEQIPNESVNVIFNEESFLFPYDTVYIDINNVSCNSMTWVNISSPVVLTGSSSSILYIYGSLTLHTNFINNFWGEIHFSSIANGYSNLKKEKNADTLTSAGNLFLNHLRMVGIGDNIVLSDDLEFFYDDYTYIDTSSNLFLVHGGINLNGNKLTCGSFLSTSNNERVINIENSEVYLKNENQKVWWVNGENLELKASNSTIILSTFLAGMRTDNGGSSNVLQYHDVIMDSILCRIENINGIVAYNKIFVNKPACEITGDFIAKSIDLSGQNSIISGTSIIDLIAINTLNCIITGEHTINKCFAKVGKTRIIGSNHIKYCWFNSNGEFAGENVFDTLLLFSGTNNGSASGVIYTFESGKTQIVTDSLNVRGNPCSNITIKSITPYNEAFIRKDNGYDLVSDFLILNNVGVLSENINFYAGENSSASPGPSDPPTGWIMENAPGYYFGWGGQNTEACIGEPYMLTTENFLGDPWTQYYWNGEATPGNNYLEVYESGSYQVRVVYSPSCYQDDYIIVEFDSCENYILEKELGRLFEIYPNPNIGEFTIESEKISGEFLLSVFDLNGVVKHKELIKPNGISISTEFNISHLNKGVYYIQLKNNTVTTMRKLIIH